MSNDMTGSQGRLCNHIIRAHAANFIAKNSNIKFNYGEYFDKMNQLGIQLFTSGSVTYKIEQHMTDINLMKYLQSNIPIYRNINVNDAYFQTKDFSNYLYKYYHIAENQQSIISSNKFKERYQNNNDVFIHVRLGDVADKNQGFEYYNKALLNLTFENGYIASDDLNHTTCQQLIQKYNLKIIDYDEVETIMFGSTCKYIILTGGSFSYIIGLFGFFSEVFYLKGFDNWYPAELFFINSWTEINI